MFLEVLIGMTTKVYGLLLIETIRSMENLSIQVKLQPMNGYGWFGVMDPLVKDYRTGTYTGTGATRDFVVPNEVAGKTLTLIKYSFRS